MVGVIVAGGDDVNDSDGAERGRFDHQLGHARVRFIGAGVLASERVGEIGVQDQRSAIVRDQESALAQPPQPWATRSQTTTDIGDEGLVFLKSRLQWSVE